MVWSECVCMHVSMCPMCSVCLCEFKVKMHSKCIFILLTLMFKTHMIYVLLWNNLGYIMEVNEDWAVIEKKS